MKELKVVEDTINFKVNKITGECFASFSIEATLCGINKVSLHRHCATMNWYTSQGLTPKMLQKANAHFAVNKGKPEAIENNYV
jgi:hypothetical protein